MRYPGPHRHETLLKVASLAIALLLFLFALSILGAKRQDRPKKVDFSPVATSPSPQTIEGSTTLRLFDQANDHPLAGRSVAFLLYGNCSAGADCPSATPLILTTDADGRVKIDQKTISQKPKIYVTGYRLDSYFDFLKPEAPNQLTLYRPKEGHKLTYDITLEEIPIWLTPVTP